jgi:DNA-3-methyladenine glycosylase II
VAVRKPVAHLLRVDPAFAGIVASAPDFAVHGRRQGDYFNALVRAIVYQQLAGKAAAAIHGRFLAIFGGEPVPAAILQTPDETLRSAGLSMAKTLAIRDLALKSTDGTVPLERIEKLPDDEIVARLSAVRGIGRWTAEMYLMFELRRLDVWPVDDLGVRQGYGLAWRLDAPPLAMELAPLGERFRPYRSVVARYCWEAVALYRGGTDPSLR